MYAGTNGNKTNKV